MPCKGLLKQLYSKTISSGGTLIKIIRSNARRVSKLSVMAVLVITEDCVMFSCVTLIFYCD